MDLIILHYHLNRGGVTRVICNQLMALHAIGAGLDRVVVLHGGRREAWPESLAQRLTGWQLELVAVPALEYDSLRSTSEPWEASVDRLWQDLQSVIDTHRLRPESTYVHWHNHSLGKNAAVPEVIARLGAAGYRMLLQIHDFVEDLRPAAYRQLLSRRGWRDPGQIANWLYPQAGSLHYAVLNGRDYQILGRAGVAPDRLHWLPNPIDPMPELPDRGESRQALDPSLPADQPLVLYPVRGIRRKNLGEFLFWAAIWGPEARFAISLAPLNPVELPSYESWRRLAQSQRLPIYFDTGGTGGLSFEQNMAAADGLLTTSVAEGFGMVFLEAWLAGRTLHGRDLPEITADFRDSGLDLQGLYDELRVPLGQEISADDVVRELSRCYDALVHAYQAEDASFASADESMSAAWEEIVEQKVVDFARLSPKLQHRVIEQVGDGGTSSRARILDCNPTWQPRLAEPIDANRMEANADVVQQSYGLEAIGRRLWNVYSQLRLAETRDRIQPLPHAEHILGSFLDPRRMYPVRMGSM